MDGLSQTALASLRTALVQETCLRGIARLRGRDRDGAHGGITLPCEVAHAKSHPFLYHMGNEIFWYVVGVLSHIIEGIRRQALGRANEGGQWTVKPRTRSLMPTDPNLAI